MSTTVLVVELLFSWTERTQTKHVLDSTTHTDRHRASQTKKSARRG